MSTRARGAAGTPRGPRRSSAARRTRPCGPAAAAAAAPQRNPSWRSPPRWRSLVMDQSLDEAELNDRQRHDEDEEHHRFGAREPELEVLEGVQIDAVNERARRVDRTASRQEVDLRERLKDSDRVDHEKEEERWRH